MASVPVLACVAGHGLAGRAERKVEAAFGGMTIMSPRRRGTLDKESDVDPLHSNESAQLRPAPPMLRLDK